ncbi:MAG: AraC family transcriptional regulator [Bacteroidales bacterium]|nr:AraC family transcriptional regulator [Bacteroidales bacterium]
MKVQEIDDKIKNLFILVSDTEKNYIRKDYALLLDPQSFYHTYKFGTPLISNEVRVLVIKQGAAKYTIGYQKYSVKAGDLLLMPSNVVFSIDYTSPDYQLHIISFTHDFVGLDTLNNDKIHNMLDNIQYLKVGPEDTLILSSFFLKMKYFLDNGNPSLSGFKSIILSFLYMLQPIAEQSTYSLSPKTVTHRHEVFLDFLKLLRGMEIPERTIKHYAEILNVTENYLSTAVKEESGRTVMQFINEKTVACIKIHLAKDVPLEKIAELTKLGNTSSLGRFFKKETGQTPMEYKTGIA